MERAVSEVNLYTNSFFESHSDGSESSARVILPILFELLSFHSVVDVGCGIGNWLSVFVEKGISDVVGVDGSYVDRQMLQIESRCFVEHDLTLPLKLDRRFELAMCMEVAEHLPEASADTLVESLVGLSDQVLFSAAIPGQLGTGHINPQWQSYWIGKFKKHGYICIDCIRPAVWHNPKVQHWYAQNSFLFVSDKARDSAELERRYLSGGRVSLTDVVHPKLQAYYVAEVEKAEQRLQWAKDPGVLGVIRSLPTAIHKALLRRMRP
jgi:SAM-dependent methyltransferase